MADGSENRRNAPKTARDRYRMAERRQIETLEIREKVIFMSYAWYDLVGSLGVMTIILTYILLQTERIKSESLIYSALNGLGAGLIAFSLLYSFNFSAFIVEILWVLISIYGIVKYLLKDKSR